MKTFTRPLQIGWTIDGISVYFNLFLSYSIPWICIKFEYKRTRLCNNTESLVWKHITKALITFNHRASVDQIHINYNYPQCIWYYILLLLLLWVTILLTNKKDLAFDIKSYSHQPLKTNLWNISQWLFCTE